MKECKFFHEVYEKHYKEIQLKKASILANLQEIKESKRILDAGCGFGVAGMLLRGKEVVGIDIYKPYLYTARKHCSFVVACDLNNLCFKNNAFDCTLFLDSAHFLRNLREVERVTRKYIVIAHFKEISMKFKHFSLKRELLFNLFPEKMHVYVFVRTFGGPDGI